MGGSDEDAASSSHEAPPEPAPEAEQQEYSEEEEHQADEATEKYYLCVKKAQARAGVSMDSEKSSSVEVDEVLEVLQVSEIEDAEYGITVTRLQTQRGWVSERTVAGNVLFEPADRDAVASAALRRAVTLRARAAALAAAEDSDDDDPFDSKDGSCAGCCCSFLRNLLLLTVALLLANVHYQFVDLSDLFMSAWYRVSARSHGGLLQQTVVPPPPEMPESTDPLFGADVWYPGLGKLGGVVSGKVET
jgi:hypothetical protein